MNSRLLPVESKRGIFLPEADLWLDPATAKPSAIVTHGHSDHVARHATTIASPGTVAILQKRQPRAKARYESVPFHTPWEHHGHRIELLPAGHILGSAMVHVTRLADGASLLYTGDFKLRPSPAAEPAVVKPADTLIMECTFGQPKYVFPPQEELRRQIVNWCRQMLDSGRAPVLLGYSLGKAQEIMRLFDDSGLRLAVHTSIAALCAVYESLGMTFPDYTVLTDEEAARRSAGRVLVFPPNTVRGSLLERIDAKATALLSGWALLPGAKYRYRVDEAFPLSDHADHPELLQLVDLVRPGRILTTHGFCQEFAATLRQRRWNAWSLQGADQIEFNFTAEL